MNKAEEQQVEMVRNYIIEAFDIARKEGMLHSKDGKHSESSESDADDILGYTDKEGNKLLLIRHPEQELPDEIADELNKIYEHYALRPNFANQLAVKKLNDSGYIRVIKE